VPDCPLGDDELEGRHYFICHDGSEIIYPYHSDACSADLGGGLPLRCADGSDTSPFTEGCGGR
jgi:hypothetical protein